MEERQLMCPRCDSTNTKFCYYNNNSKAQPRHYCRSCRKHWTEGGVLRNVAKKKKKVSKTKTSSNRKNKKVGSTGKFGTVSRDAVKDLGQKLDDTLTQLVIQQKDGSLSEVLTGIDQSSALFDNFGFCDVGEGLGKKMDDTQMVIQQKDETFDAISTEFDQSHELFDSLVCGDFGLRDDYALGCSSFFDNERFSFQFPEVGEFMERIDKYEVEDQLPYVSNNGEIDLKWEDVLDLR